MCPNRPMCTNRPMPDSQPDRSSPRRPRHILRRTARRVCCLLCVGLMFAAPRGGIAQTSVPRPVPLIFDTDVGNDIDDAMALAVIHALASRGECKLLAVTITKDNQYAAPFADLVNTFYGRGDVPIGVVRDGITPQDYHYVRPVSSAKDGDRQRYPHDLLSGRDAPEAVALLRDVLAGCADRSVVMVQVGFSTNFARLLDSKPDRHSPLDGKALVQRKVRLLSVMAGAFDGKPKKEGHKEYNVVMDIKSGKKVLGQWPTPIVASGYEIGIAIQYPGRSMQEDFAYVRHHPVREAYELWGKMPYDRPTWDLTSVLFAVRPQRGYFDLSPPGRFRVDDQGRTHFKAEAGGPHRYLKANAQQIVRAGEALVMLCSQPPMD